MPKYRWEPLDDVLGHHMSMNFDLMFLYEVEYILGPKSSIQAAHFDGEDVHILFEAANVDDHECHILHRIELDKDKPTEYLLFKSGKVVHGPIFRIVGVRW